MPKNPTRKGFFFFFVEGWQPLPHCQGQLCRRREGSTALPVALSLLGLTYLPHPLKYQGVYKINVILCFLAGYILLLVFLYGSSEAQKAWGGAALYIFSIFL